jgi:hypothetical protein
MARKKSIKEWTRKEDAMLGKAPDQHVGTKLGRSKISVWLRRKKLGIAAHQYGPTPKSSPHFLPRPPSKNLGRAMPDKVRKKISATLKAAYQKGRIHSPLGKLWTRKELSLLGTKADSVIADRLGRTLNAVRLRRSRLKIPRYRKTAKNRGR